VGGGRIPPADDEVLLGRRLAHDRRLSIGDRVPIDGADRTRTFDVVGIGVLPDGAGEAALMTAGGLRQIDPRAEVGWQYVRLDETVTAVATRAGILDAFDHCTADCDVIQPSPPADVRHLDRVGNLPLALAGVISLLGLGSMAHALLLVARSNRRSIALLRAIGASRRLLRRAVVAQTTMICVGALLLGLPLGWIVGRLLWGAFADSLGVVPEAVPPSLTIAAATGALVVVAHLVALIPAARAARAPAAAALQADA
jgi:putative ABC transport system permease protein